MPLLELPCERLVLGAGSLAAAAVAPRRTGERHDLLGRRAALGPRPALDESDDRLVNVRRRREIPFVHAKLGAAPADHHVGVAREPARRDTLESERAEPREKVVGRAQLPGVELEHELRRVASSEQRFQRVKHCSGPGENARVSLDQTSVDTSISLSLMRMLFTDDGRPPRDRSLIVPEIEMTVPRCVCST